MLKDEITFEKFFTVCLLRSTYVWVGLCARGYVCVFTYVPPE